MTIHQGELHRNAFKPALVLNADFQPLNYAPLSLWDWQDAVKAVFQDRVSVVSNYDEVIRSPSFEMPLPAVVALREYQKVPEFAAFTRMNVRLRDRHRCAYCGCADSKELTFDHYVPKSKGGILNWENTLTSCVACNQRKADRSPEEVGLRPNHLPYRPTTHQLMAIGREFPPQIDLSAWQNFAYWSVPLTPP